MYLKIFLLLISFLILQPSFAETSMYDDVLISPVQTLKYSPQLIKEYIEIQPYVYIPIINGIFANYSQSPTSHKAKINSYERQLFIDKHKEQIQEFKEIPLIALIADKKDMASDSVFVRKFNLNEEDYSYKVEIINLLEKTYGFSKKQKISSREEQVLVSIIYYTNSRDFKVYEHIINNQKIYDYNLAFIYYRLSGNKRIANKVRKHILQNTFEEYYAKQMEVKKENPVAKEIKEFAEFIALPITIPYQLIIEPVGMIYSNAHAEWEEDVKFKIYKENRSGK